jgi:hypothetical protein
MENVMTAQQIYQELYAVCPPYPLPGPWAALKGDPAVRTAPPDLAPWLDQMSKKSAAADLIRTGVAEAASNGGLKLSARLEGAGKPLVFLYPEFGDGPSAVLTAQGMLDGRRFPVTAAFTDKATRRAVTGAKQLLIAFSMEDVAVLRGVGLPATFAFGMDRLSRTAVFRLYENCDWESDSPWLFPPTGPQPSPELPSPGEPYMSNEPDCSSAPVSVGLTFVGGSIAELRHLEPTQLKPVIAYMGQIREHLAIENMHIGVWSPSRRFLEQTHFRLKLRFYERTAAEILQDIDHHALESTSGELPVPAPPVDFRAAREKYRNALRDHKRRSCSSERLQHARETFHERLEQEVLLPILSPSGSPAVRNLRAALMGVSGLAHRLMPLIEAELSEERARTLGDEPLPHLKELQGLMGMITTLTKQIQQAEPHRSFSEALTGKRHRRTLCRVGGGGFGSRFTGN